MFSFVEMFAIAAMVFSGAAYVPFVKATWTTRGSEKAVKPHRTSIVLWLIIDGLLYSSLRNLNEPGATLTSYMFLAFIIGSVILLVLAIPYGKGGFSKSNIAVFILAMLSIYVWKTADNPQLALIMQITANILACIPTLEQAWSEPWELDLLTWKLFITGGIMSLFTVESWSLGAWMAWLPPLHIVILQIFIIAPQLKYNRRVKDVVDPAFADL